MFQILLQMLVQFFAGKKIFFFVTGSGNAVALKV
jgi:hypothetical protein